MVRTDDGFELFRQVLTQELCEHWVLFLMEGIVLVILGVLAILVPMIATIPVAIVIGWLILISGVVGLVTTFMARDVRGLSDVARGRIGKTSMRSTSSLLV